MQLELENIGKIKKADIVIDGITVIAGENGTGKSTVGKALFSVFNSFYNLGKQIAETRREMVAAVIEAAMRNEDCFAVSVEKLASEIITEPLLLRSENQERLRIKLNEYIIPLESGIEGIKYSDELILEITGKIREILKIEKDEIFKRVLQKKINGEFKRQITTMGSVEKGGRIHLYIKENSIEIKLQAQDVESISNAVSLKTQAIYVDNPLIMDRLANYSRDFLERLKKSKRYSSHRRHLELCLIDDENKSDVEQAIDELIVDNQIEDLEQRLNGVCAGEFRNNKYYYKEDDEPVLDVRNVSSGIKIFMVIKQLLRNRKLREKGVLILDEPEVYLHPKWQLAFAEIIVMLQKKYDMHILLTTHSPYFLRAIEIYSAKNSIADRCNFYMAKNEGKVAIIENVTNNTEEIYKIMLESFEALQMETYSE